MSVGKLTIELLEANIRHDDDLFGKMDPYVVFKSREFTWKSEVVKKGGKKPKWNN
jgi:Ca2+-dependent lipid-binding protein